MVYKILSADHYLEECKKATKEPESFWADIARNFSWIKEWDQVLRYDFKDAKVSWFGGGKVNIVSNCLDRHLEKKASDVVHPEIPSCPCIYLTLNQF